MNMNKKALILVAFGTADINALRGICNIFEVIKERHYNTFLSFTANYVRKNLKDLYEKEKNQINREIPNEVFEAKGLIHILGECFDSDFYDLRIQPLFIFHGKEYEGIKSTVEQISQIKDKDSFRRRIILGRPLLGTNLSKKYYREDLMEVVEALGDDVYLAKSKNACLVYVGHGNDNYASSSYAEMEYYMRKRYGDMIFFGNIKGFPFAEDLPKRIKEKNFSRIILRPFMLVAGGHAVKDIFGEKESIKALLKEEGLDIYEINRGLAEENKIINIFIKRIEELLSGGEF